MKTISLYFLSFYLLSGLVFAQDTLTVYYDEDWTEVFDKNEASFYRKAYKQDNKIWAVNDYFISNKIQMAGYYKMKGFKVRQGRFTYYYENGNKKSEGEYVNDKRENEWNFWYESGGLKITENYKRGLLLSAKSYYENGKIGYSGNYRNEKKHGKWDFWNKDGRKIFEGYYSNGLRDGEWIRYFRDGQMILNFDNGKYEGKPFGSVIRRE